MKTQSVAIPYDRDFLELPLEKLKHITVLRPDGTKEASEKTQEAIVRESLRQPIGSARLSDLAESSRKVLVITSDHTRPLPSKITLPLLLEEIRRKNPTVDVRIIVATGFHRQTQEQEMVEKFGSDLIEREQFIIHNCHDQEQLLFKGLLPSGGELWLNRLVDWADLIVAEGFIEPHFFAGFSGGRKSLMPGLAGAATVLANHCAEFINSPFARTGILQNNPIHRDMVYAAEKANLAFILNVTLDEEKKINAAFSGHPVQAHEAGCTRLAELAGISCPQAADLVVTSNGGYPLDQNIYQAVKGMTAAEACVREGGVIIMVSACADGHGGQSFYHWLADATSPAEVTRQIGAITRQDTRPDQWQAQILARVLQKATVIMVSEQKQADLIEAMHMRYQPTIEAALAEAFRLVGKDPQTVVIPDGVAVIVRN